MQANAGGCPILVVSGSAHASTKGVYHVVTGDLSQDRPVYRMATADGAEGEGAGEGGTKGAGKMYLYYWLDRNDWLVGPDYTHPGTAGARGVQYGECGSTSLIRLASSTRASAVLPESFSQGT